MISLMVGLLAGILAYKAIAAFAVGMVSGNADKKTIIGAIMLTAPFIILLIHAFVYPRGLVACSAAMIATIVVMAIYYHFKTPRNGN